jgi:hypothetical protein
MATAQQDDFDVLKFFITVMVLLTIIVAGFAAVLQGKVADTTKKIKAEIATLEQMDEVASKDLAFREWVQRDREGRNVGQGSSGDFKARMNENAGKQGLKVTDSSEQGAIELGGGTRELRFRVRMQGFRVEQFTRFLVSIEQDWPGAKVREITELSFDEKNQLWNGQVVLAIFKHTEPQGP